MMKTLCAAMILALGTTVEVSPALRCPVDVALLTAPPFLPHRPSSFVSFALTLCSQRQAQKRKCKYTTKAQLQAALTSFGCNNLAGDCSAKCAHHYLPISRECKTLIKTNHMQAFTKICVATLHPSSVDTETGRECHDGKDNDGDGRFDCQDKDCAHFRGCRRQNAQLSHTKCASARILPTILACAQWSRKAEADGKITVSDGFCTSSCHGRLAPLWGQCKDRMSRANKLALSFVAPLLSSCDGSHQGASSCKMNLVTQHCGGNPVAAENKCDAKCVRTVDAMSRPCKSVPQFRMWSHVNDKCSDTRDAENCAAGSAKFLSYVDESCCRDTNCKDVPTHCTVECAASFLPYFSRCGRAVFGKNRAQLIKFERFNRKCAVTAGRNVKAPSKDENQWRAQLDGPNPKDICSHTRSCTKCNGGCGWCAAEVKNKHAVHKNGGGWCSSECVTTNGECRAHGGVKKHESGALCFNGKDDDHDGRADCDDPDCKKDPRSKFYCKKTETGRECFDGKDNDGDGHKDCSDQDCLNNPLVRQKCRTSHNDGVNRETGALCFNGIDDDHDGRADCDDYDCKRDPRSRARCLHTETGAECFNGRDDDRDGKKDCQDPDCQRDPRAKTHCHIHSVKHENGKLCFNGIDDDHDGKPDCKDPDCLRDPRARAHCTETGRECFDGKDNDHDGKKDCQDPDCLRNPAIRARCRGGH
jgi:hypothetical protein